jgi:hypothetical protein
MRSQPRIILFARISSIALGFFLCAFIFWQNLAPIGAKFKDIAFHPGVVGTVGPVSRISLDHKSGILSQLGNLIYYTNPMKQPFDQARVQVTFRNTSLSQEVDLGYRDETEWHYALTALDVPFLNAITWPKLSGNGLTLYQKTPTYSSVNEFLMNLPEDKVVGTLGYDLADSDSTSITMPNYQPAKQDTVINTPLRGETTMYAYLQNEPFHLTVTKQDLNWYADPDVVNIKVYKDNDVVATGIINDDGNATNNHKVGAPQSVTINNPKGNAENGVYKIVIDASDDSVVTRIQTNLHKLVFAGPIYPVENSGVYGGVATGTSPTTLYTDAPTVEAQTYHSATQTVQVGGQSLAISSADAQPTVSAATEATDSALVPVVVPQSDAVINGVGYFSFTPDEFFAPTPYKTLNINDSTDLGLVDYIITNYQPPVQLGGGWESQTLNFNLNSAVTQKGKLSWLISAPGLQENGRSIEIKSISMTLTKKGWLSK